MADCDLCGGTTGGLSSVPLERPSLAGPKAFTASLCEPCVAAARGAAASRPPPGAR